MTAQDPPTTSVCHACSARLRPGDPWCTLCHTPIRAESLTPAAAASGSGAGSLVGAELPPHVLAELDAGLAAIADRERALRTDSSTLRLAIGALRDRPALGATVVGAGVLVVLLLTLWVLGRVV